MTNITKTMLDATVKDLKAELKKEMEVALGRIKALEEKSAIMEAKIASLEKDNTELKAKVEGTANLPGGTTEGLWAEMVKLPAVKNSITSIVSVESDHSKQREKNLVIMEKVSNDPKLLLEGTGDELVKEEVLKVLTAIGEQGCNGKVKATRFKANGPVLLACDDMGTKLKILKAARLLKDRQYAGVFINNDRTVAEAAHEKGLRADAKDKNSNLTKGTGNLKYEEATINGKKVKWYWGVRGALLKKIFKPFDDENQRA